MPSSKKPEDFGTLFPDKRNRSRFSNPKDTVTLTNEGTGSMPLRQKSDDVSKETEDFGRLRFKDTKSPNISPRPASEQIEHIKGWPERLGAGAVDLTNAGLRNILPVAEYLMLAPDWTMRNWGWLGKVLRGGVKGTYGSLVPLTTGSYGLEAMRKNIEGQREEIGEEFPHLASENLVDIREPLESAERVARAMNRAARDPKLREDLRGVVETHLPTDMAWGTGFQALQRTPAAARFIGQRGGAAFDKQMMYLVGEDSRLAERFRRTGSWRKPKPVRDKSRAMRKKYFDPISTTWMPLGDIPIGAIGRKGGTVTSIPTRKAAAIWEEVTGEPAKFISLIAHTPVAEAIARMVNRFARLIPTQVGRRLKANVDETWNLPFQALKAHAKRQGATIPDDFINKRLKQPFMGKLADRLKKQLKSGLDLQEKGAINLYELSTGYHKSTPYYKMKIPQEWFADITEEAANLGRRKGLVGEVGKKVTETLEGPFAAAMRKQIRAEEVPTRWGKIQGGTEKAFTDAGLWKNGKAVETPDVTWEKLDILRRDLGELGLGSSEQGQRLQALVANKQEQLFSKFIENEITQLNVLKGGAPHLVNRSAQEMGENIEALQHAKRHYKLGRKEFREVQEAKEYSLTKKALKAEPYKDPELFIDSMISGELDSNTIIRHRGAIISEGGREAWDQAKGMWWWNLVDDAGSVAGEIGDKAEINFNRALNAWNKIRDRPELRSAIFDRPGEFEAAEKLMTVLGMAQSSGIAQQVSKGAFDAGALGTFGRVGMYAASSLVLQGGLHASAVAAAFPAILVATVRGMSSPGAVRIFSDGMTSAILHSEGIRTPQVIQSIIKMGVIVRLNLDESNPLATDDAAPPLTGEQVGAASDSTETVENDTAEMKELDALTGLN
jgi:hypothetical protein